MRFEKRGVSEIESSLRVESKYGRELQTQRISSAEGPIEFFFQKTHLFINLLAALGHSCSSGDLSFRSMDFALVVACGLSHLE